MSTVALPRALDGRRLRSSYFYPIQMLLPFFQSSQFLLETVFSEIQGLSSLIHCLEHPLDLCFTNLEGSPLLLEATHGLGFLLPNNYFKNLGFSFPTCGLGFPLQCGRLAHLGRGFRLACARLNPLSSLQRLLRLLLE